MFEDILILTFGNALVMGHCPEAVTLENVMEKHKTHPQDVVNLGFFDTGSPNYTTYYPDVNPEDFIPKDNEFIEPLVRALSEVTVHKQWAATSFSKKDVLKNSLKLLLGQTIYIDHETSIGNAIGAVSDVSWEPAYTAADGTKIPAGILAKLKIDGKANPRLARLMNMQPPAIHSFSVTVSFAWEPSHKNIPIDEFHSKLGTYDAEGKMYERVATRIICYKEISLVNHGADPYAQIIKDGEITNPKYAAITYENSEGKRALKYDFIDTKTAFLSNKEEPTIPKTSIKNNSDKNMKEILILLAATFAATTENKEDDALAAELMPKLTEYLSANNPTKIEALQNQLTEKTTEVNTLTEKVTGLETQLAAQPSLNAAGNKYLTELRNETKRLFNILNPGKTDDPVLKLVESSGVEVLEVLKNQYSTLVEASVPMACTKCGSKEISRSSAKPNNPENHTQEHGEDKGGKNLLKNKANEKMKGAVNKMHG
jgi:hypothetical protein